MLLFGGGVLLLMLCTDSLKTSINGKVDVPASLPPGTEKIRGTRVATSKFEYLAHSPCSPSDQPAATETQEHTVH